MRGLAAYLEVTKPVISRALDRLAESKLVKRVTDPREIDEAYSLAGRRLGFVFCTI